MGLIAGLNRGAFSLACGDECQRSPKKRLDAALNQRKAINGRRCGSRAARPRCGWAWESGGGLRSVPEARGDGLRGTHRAARLDRKSTRLNASHVKTAY